MPRLQPMRSGDDRGRHGRHITQQRPDLLVDDIDHRARLGPLIAAHCCSVEV
jgi:hypothetical protein